MCVWACYLLNTKNTRIPTKISLLILICITLSLVTLLGNHFSFHFIALRCKRNVISFDQSLRQRWRLLKTFWGKKTPQGENLSILRSCKILRDRACLAKILARFSSVILQNPGRSYQDSNKDLARSFGILVDPPGFHKILTVILQNLTRSCRILQDHGKTFNLAVD